MIVDILIKKNMNMNNKKRKCSEIILFKLTKTRVEICIVYLITLTGVPIHSIKNNCLILLQTYFPK